MSWIAAVRFAIFLWSLTSHELVSTHGFSSTTAQNHICVWKYLSLNMVVLLTGHMSCMLHLAMSPDGETIVIDVGNKIWLWNAFPLSLAVCTIVAV